MKLYNESYYLKSANSNEAIETLIKANHNGYILTKNDNWISFVVESKKRNFKPNTNVVQSNAGTIIYLASLEDYGWSVSVVEQNQIVFNYSRFVREGIVVDDSCYDLQVLMRLMDNNLQSMLLVSELLFGESNFRPHEAVGKFAALLGIRYDTSVSYGKVKQDPKEFYERYQHLIEVRKMT